MKRLKNKWIILIVVLSLLLGTSYGIGNYFVNYALSPTSSSDQRNVEDEVEINDKDKNIIEVNKIEEDKKGEEFLKTVDTTKIKVQSMNLEAKYKEHENQHYWTILVHGYKSNNQSMMSYGKEYYQRGYNVLLPDNRAHGNSEGDYVGMGWLDKDDISCWIDWIVKKDKEAKVIVHGVSMGGATTMMLSGDDNEHVIGYIEDCGYTSVWDIFASELDKRFSLPTFPVLDISNIVASIKAGYSFKEASSINQLKKNQKPMLFIHGGKDDFVPTSMVYKLYDNAACTKDIYIVKQAGHAESKNYNPKEYWKHVFEFIDKNILEQ
jgi:Prolyl oligopeptidase family.